jgi:hypothetical protein
MKLDWDYLLEIGSDDLVKDELIDLYSEFFGKHKMFGSKDAVIINSENGQTRRLKSDTVYGLGRCISREVFECCYVVECLCKENIIAPGRTTRANEKNFFKVKQAEELEKLGATHIEIEPYQEYDCAYVHIEPYCRRLETDDEFNERINLKKRREEHQKIIDLEQLEKLKSKYGL